MISQYTEYIFIIRILGLLLIQELTCAQISPIDCDCGLDKQSRGRILGGTEVEAAEFPWMAAFIEVSDGYRLFCGGSLINNNYVLSAAHCFFDVNGETNETRKKSENFIEVVIGRLFLYPDPNYEEQPGEVRIQRSAEYVDIHPDFNLVSRSNDVALVKLKEAITEYTLYVYPVCLPPSDPSYESYKDAEVMLAGWGSTTSKTGPSTLLMKAILTVLPMDSCKLNKPNFDSDTMICAFQKGTAPCIGDDGGPLFYRTAESRYFQIGVNIYTSNCDQKSADTVPSYYVTLTSVLPWLQKTTLDAAQCRNP